MSEGIRSAESRRKGSQGKDAEKDVRKHLEALQKRYAGFEFERIYDARAARGRLPKRPGDFQFYRRLAQPVHGLIEVKEVAHDYRLPKKNFTQGPKLRLRQLSGGIIVVLVYHTGIQRWRCPPLHILLAAAPSWDLSGYPSYETLDDVFNSDPLLKEVLL